MKQTNVIIKGFSFIKENPNTKASQVPHIAIEIWPGAFGSPIKSQSYDEDSQTLTIEFEKPLKAMSPYLFPVLKDGKMYAHVIESITLPDTLTEVLEVDESTPGICSQSRLDMACGAIKGKHAVSDAFWAPEGNVLLWGANKDITTLFAEAKGIKSLPEYFTLDVDEKLTIPEGVETMGEHCFEGCGYIKQVKLPKTLKVLPKYAFHDCRWLTKINLTNIEEIHDFALSATSLRKVKFGKKIRFIGNGAFTRAIRLHQPIFEGGDQFVVENGKGIVCDNVLVLCPAETYPDTGSTLHEYVIPENVTRIGSYSCELAPSYLTFPAGLKEVGYNAFGNYFSAKTVEFPDSVEKIEGRTFFGNSYLKELTIPAKVKTIPEDMVTACPALRKVVILGTEVETVHHSFHCSKTDNGGRPVSVVFEKLEIHSANPPRLIVDKIGDTDIDFLAAGQIEVPAQSVELYKNAPEWSKYAENIKAGDF